MAQAADRTEYLGVNHVALVCRDMAETTDFYENVLDMPLVRAQGLPGRGQHFFFDCGGGSLVAFMWFPNAPAAAPGIASQNLDVRKDGAQTAIASMNHLAINVRPEAFDAAVARLQRRGVKVNIINHNDGEPDTLGGPASQGTWIRSAYFTDPNGIKMELAAYTRAFDDARDLQCDPVDADGRPVDYLGARRRRLEPAE